MPEDCSGDRRRQAGVEQGGVLPLGEAGVAGATAEQPGAVGLYWAVTVRLSCPTSRGPNSGD